MHLKSGDQQPPVQQFLMPFLTQGEQEDQGPLAQGMCVEENRGETTGKLLGHCDLEKICRPILLGYIVIRFRYN